MILLVGCAAQPVGSQPGVADTADSPVDSPVDGAESGSEPPPLVGDPPERFTVTTYTSGLPEGDYRGLSVAPDGRVWAANEMGLIVLDPADGSVRTYGTADFLLTDAPLSVLAASDGTVWVGHAGDDVRQGEQVQPEADGSLSMVKPIDFTQTTEETTIYRLREQPYGDGAGDIWMGANEGALVYDTSLGAFYEHAHPTHPHGAYLGLAFGDDADEWALDQYQVSRWAYANDGLLSSSLVEYWTVWPVEVEETIAGTDADAGDGFVWLTSSLFGVARVTVGDEAGSSMTELYTEPASANAVRVDSAGRVWVGADDGLWFWDDTTFVPVVDDRLPVGEVDELAVAPDAVWAAVGSTLLRITGDPRLAR